MFGGIGGLEIIIILIVGIILFGVIKMPRIARLLGSGFGGYNKLKRGLDFNSLMDRMAGGDDDPSDGGRQQEGPERSGQAPGWQQPPYPQGGQTPGWQQPYPQGGQAPGWQQPYPQGGPDQSRQEPPRGGGENPAGGPDSSRPDGRA
jgi:Sec-independent protein translocase protein TatA